MHMRPLAARMETRTEMAKTRMLTVGLAALTLACSVPAQFDGPAPLSWRWTGTSSVTPSGTPVIDGNSVYVAVGSRIYALDKDSGNQKWKWPNVEPIDGSFRTGQILVDGLVIAASDNKSVFAVDTATGDRKWQYVSPVAILGTPVSLGNKLLGLATSDNTLMVINSETGDPVWKSGLKVYDGLTGRIAAYQGNLLYLTQTNNLVSVDGLTAKQNWSRQFSGFSADSRPVVFGDTILLNSGSFVVALSAGRGNFLWSGDAGGAVIYPVAAAPGVVAAATREGTVSFFDLSSGRKLYRNVIDLGSQPISAPSAVGKSFIFPTANGALNMIEPRTGALQWVYTIKPLNRIAANPGSDAGANPGGEGLGSPGGAAGGRTGGGGAGGRFGGGGRTGGGQTGNQNQQAPQKVISIPAAGPGVLSDNTFLVLARDGSLLAFDRASGVDLTPPAVSMTFPTPGMQVSSLDLEIFFQIDDEASGLKVSSLVVAADGKTLEGKLNREGVFSARFSSLSKNGTLSNGRHVFTVTCSDWMGNTVVQQFSLEIDNALPRIAAPKPNDQNNGVRGAGGGAGGGRDGGGRDGGG